MPDEFVLADLIDVPAHAVLTHLHVFGQQADNRAKSGNPKLRRSPMEFGDTGGREQLRVVVAAAVQVGDQVMGQVFRGGYEQAGGHRSVRQRYIGRFNRSAEPVLMAHGQAVLCPCRIRVVRVVHPQRGENAVLDVIGVCFAGDSFDY